MTTKRRNFSFLALIISATLNLFLLLKFHVEKTSIKHQETAVESVQVRYKEIEFNNNTYNNRNFEKNFRRNDTRNLKKKTVLFWTKYFTDPRWSLPSEVFQDGYLESVGCPATNCVFTWERSYLPSLNDFDAFLFHATEEGRNSKAVPSTRKPHQIYILTAKESSMNCHRNFDEEDYVFNLTMTYRIDSDIPWFYGLVLDLSTGKEIAPALDVQWKQPDESFNDSAMKQLALKKTKTAAWFVSHCNSESKRDDLTRTLQKYIDVDVYGHCGPLKCQRFSSKCDQLLNTTYYFHLSFENTLCTDYVTEKVFGAMLNFVIPVIYSGAELSRFLPPKSYIDAQSFETAEKLAIFLKFLTSNPDEYVKYFWWRKHYKIVLQDPINPCKICMKLNEPKFSSKRQVYASIRKWFQEDDCTSPKIKFDL